MTIEQRPDHDAAETEGSRRWPCVTGHVRGGALAVASAATPLCAGSRVPDRKDLAPGGAVSAVLRGRRGGVGACSARGLSWLIKGDVGQEVASPSLAMGKDPVAACVQACPQLGLRLARKKDKALRTDSRVPPSSPQFPRRRSGQRLPEARRGKASAGGGRPRPARGWSCFQGFPEATGRACQGVVGDERAVNYSSTLSRFASLLFLKL